MDQSRVDIGCATLTSLIGYAFRIRPYRVAGPDWMVGRAATRFDIDAKLPQDASEKQVPEMLQALLADRFKLAIHRGTKEQEVSALVVAKGGLKVKEAAPGADASAMAADDPNAPASTLTQVGGLQTVRTPLPNADGKGYVLTNPRMGAVRATEGPSYTFRWDAPSTTFAGLADLLDGIGPLPDITDMTRLKGRYQVVLEVSLGTAFDVAAARMEPGGGPPGDPAEDQDLRDALMKALNDGLRKLGLQLEHRKGTVETLVVDHVEKTPSGN
jgi:uncharacterized protein (TIGR03435 family)